MHGDECANQCNPHTSYTRRACCTLPVTRAGRVCASWTDHLSKCSKMFKLHIWIGGGGAESGATAFREVRQRYTVDGSAGAGFWRHEAGQGAGAQ